LENIAWGDPNPNRRKVEECARLACAWDFIAALPEGLDSSVGERGGRLSGGQRQRLAIARALYGNPWLLIFDEATSSLDKDSESAIITVLERLKGLLTMIIVTHRHSTVQMADEVLVLKEGRIVRRGPPELELGRKETLPGTGQSGRGNVSESSHEQGDHSHDGEGGP
jgi:ATP-binding cassette subfamily B protein